MSNRESGTIRFPIVDWGKDAPKNQQPREMQISLKGKRLSVSDLEAVQDFFCGPNDRELWMVKCGKATVAVAVLREVAEAILTVARLSGGAPFDSYKLFVLDHRTGQVRRTPAHRISLDPQVWKAEREEIRRIKPIGRRRQAVTAEVCHRGAPAKNAETRQAGA